MASIIQFPGLYFETIETYGTVAGLTIALGKFRGIDRLQVVLISDELMSVGNKLIEGEAVGAIESFPLLDIEAAKAAGRTAFLTLEAAVSRLGGEG